MKKILYVVAQEPIGGVGSYVNSLCKNLSKEDVAIYLLESSDSEDKQFNKDFRQLSNTDGITKLPALKAANIVKYLISAYRFYRDNGSKFDVVHVHAPNIAFIHCYLAQKFGISIRIVEFHSTKYSNNFLKAIRNKVLILLAKKHTTLFAATSEESAKELTKLIKKEVVVLKNTINSEKYLYKEIARVKWRKYLNLGENDCVLGYVANFIKGKNHKALIDMMEKIKADRSIYLLFVGEGAQASNLEEYAKSKSVADRILFMGKQSRVNEIYSAMDIFLNPSEFEGFSRVTLEAQINGLYCIVSPGIPQSVTVFNDSIMFLKENRADEFKSAFLQTNLSEKRLKHKRIIDSKEIDNLFSNEKAVKVLQKMYEL